ncbi:MAG: PilN domain-containing protein [Parcubacteria group bacterium]|nr:PilN domain-containing protein [Parcubacteria group bacterium]
MNQIGYEFFNTKKLPPTWPRGLLTFILIVTLLVIGIAIGLNYYNKLQTNKLEKLTKEFDTLRLEFPLEQEKEIAAFEKRISNLTDLLNNHVYFSNVLNILEKITHPQIYYMTLDYTVDKNAITLSGIAKNQEILSEAINGLVNDPQDIKTVILKNIKTNTDKTVNFNIELLLNSQVLKYQQLP